MQPRARVPRPATGMIIRRMINAALLAVMAVGLSAVFLGRVLPILGHPVFVVAGASMSPALAVGSAVILTPVSATELRVDDVVTLRSGPAQAVFTHRIVRLVERDGEVWLETRGDANRTADPSITPASAVLGRVSLGVPLLGFLLALAASLPGLILLLSSGALLLTLGWLLDGSAATDHRPVAAIPTSERRRLSGQTHRRRGRRPMHLRLADRPVRR